MAPRKLSFHLTRGGRAFLVLCILLTLGAFNASLNMTYLLASLLIAVLLVSLTAPFWSTLGLHARRGIRQTPYAGEPFEADVSLTSRRRTAARVVSVQEPLCAEAGDGEPPGGKPGGAEAHP